MKYKYEIIASGYMKDNTETANISEKILNQHALMDSVICL